MDSKSVHRVAESLNLKRHFDSKLKLWTIGDGDKALSFSVDEIAKMSSGDLREKLFAKHRPGQAISTSARTFIDEKKDGNTSPEKAGDKPQPKREPPAGNESGTKTDAQAPEQQKSSDVAQAAELLKQTGGGVTAALQQHAEQVAAGKEGDMKKKVKKGAAKKQGGEQTKRQPPKREEGVIKINGVAARKPKRVSEENKGKLWLESYGIHKWALRNKAKVHGAPKDVQKLLEQETKWYTPKDMREIVKHAVFTAQDKATLAKPDSHTKYAVKCATSARDIAEKVLADCK